MFCENCGKKLEDNSKFCPYCGYKIADFEQPYPGNSIEDNESIFGGDVPGTDIYDFSSDTSGSAYTDNDMNAHTYGETEQDYSASVASGKKKSGGKIVLVIAIIVALIIIGLGAFYFVTDGEFFDSDIFNKESAQQTADGEKNPHGNESQTNSSTDDAAVTQAPSANADKMAPDKLYSDVEYYVNVSSVTIYKGPDAKAYKAVCTATKDEALTVKGGHTDYPEWVYVYCKRTDDYGWLPVALVSEQKASDITTTFGNTDEVIYYDVGARFNVTIDVGEGHNLNLRRQPDTADKKNVIILIPNGATALVLGVSSTDNNWYYVEYTDVFGTYYGYIYSEHTTR